MPPAADALRMIAIVLSVVAGAAILSVIRLHWRAWRALRAKSMPVGKTIIQNWRIFPTLRRELGTWKAANAIRKMNWMALRRVSDSPGLTPFHVWAVSVAHGMLLFGLSMGLLDQIGTPGVTWRVSLYIGAPALTLIALVAIGFSQNRRVKNPGAHPFQVTVEERYKVSIDN